MLIDKAKEVFKNVKQLTNKLLFIDKSLWLHPNSYFLLIFNTPSYIYKENVFQIASEK
jgi:hypothetical protein